MQTTHEHTEETHPWLVVAPIGTRIVKAQNAEDLAAQLGGSVAQRFPSCVRIHTLAGNYYCGRTDAFRGAGVVDHREA